MAPTPLERCLETARAAGVPKDQAKRLVESGYIPLPWQWSFHAAARAADFEDGPVDVGCGGARGPGKSHAILAQAALDDCQRVKGLKGLFLRQTGLAAKESFDDLIEKVVAGRAIYERAGNVLRIPNTGSRIILGGFKDEGDIDKYIGVEYDFIIVEELTQLTEEKYKKLRGSLRTSKPNWRPRMYTSFNPGGIGHTWVKARYVTPFRKGQQSETRFIPSTYRANPYLNREYITYLEGLDGDLGRMWREGEWDIFAGQYFSEWSHDIHVCAPFAIPLDWRRFCALDYGYSAPSSLGWYACDPDGTLYRYRELYVTMHTASMLAEKFVSLTNPSEVIEYIVADPAIWAKKGERDDKLSGAEVFQNKVKELTKKTPRLLQGENARVPGWLVVREWLRPFHRDDKLTAKLQVFSSCAHFTELFPSQLTDARNPEDVDTDGEDHCADELRYAVMSRPRPSSTPEQLAERHFRERMKRNQAARRKGPSFNRSR